MALVAVPFEVVILTTVFVKLGVLKLTVNTAVVPSTTVTLSILTVGGALASVMVPVPWALALLVLPLVTVPVKVNVSFGSFNTSVNVGTLTVVVVCPAGMVTVVVTDV